MNLRMRCSKCRRYYAPKQKTCPKCGKPREKRPLWSIHFTHQGKREKPTIGRMTYKEARAHFQDFRLAFRDWKAKIRMPFKELAEAYKADLKILHPSSYNAACNHFKHMEAEWGHLWTDKITTAMIDRFKRDLLINGYSAAYVDRHLQSLKAAYNRQGLPNPVEKVKLIKPDNRLVRRLEDEEVKAFIKVAKKEAPNVLDMFLVAINTGLRKTNVFELRREEVDFQIGVIRLKQKGGRYHTLHMNETVREILKNRPKHSSGYFFVNPNTEKPYTSIWKQWTRCKELANINRPFRWHDLRHHFASMIAMSSGNLKAIQDLLGHKDLSMVLRYAHLVPDYLSEVVDSVEVPK